MHLVIISGYHGGSHKAWAEGYQRHSDHQVELITLPARFWKWRMHGGAVTLARRFLEEMSKATKAPPDLLLFTDMIDASTFLALVRRRFPQIPTALYMHENQLTYPLPSTPGTGPMRRQKGERDLHYAFINYASMLAVDQVYFNSEFHRQELLGELPKFLGHFPEYNELTTVSKLEAMSKVLPAGIDCAALDSAYSEVDEHLPPLVIWNQRWEYDKNPVQFLKGLLLLKEAGYSFRLAMCGENYSQQPAEFDAARESLSERIVHWGYADQDLYARLLWKATITASTAYHEFFGISILEAMYCHTFAAIPNRLSYPELLAEELHADCLYEDEEHLIKLLSWAIDHPSAAQALGQRLSRSASRYDWRRIAPNYDVEFERFH